MLLLSTEKDTVSLEVNMHIPDAPRYRLIDRELLRTLMARTFDGTKVTVRELAEAAACSPSLIGHLLSGSRETVTAETAKAIVTRIGVELLILFAPLAASTSRAAVRAVSA
jgi:transcriptional regulator with XRE-family HTH domain